MSGASAVSTLILSRSEIAGLMDADSWVTAVEGSFAAAAEGKAGLPAPMAIAARGGTFHAKGAGLELDRLYVALKLNGNFPDNPSRGLPTIQGALLLCDGEDGSLLAIMDSIEITLRRTAAATALAARYLARPESRAILVCGCGEQGRAHLQALREVLPLAGGFAWDSDPVKAESFAQDSREQGLAMTSASSLEEAAERSDVIVTCTTSRKAFLGAALVRPGTFVAAVGADSPDKNEIGPDLMKRARVVADALEQCAVMGDLHHALRGHVMQRSDVHAELAELVAGTKQGRTSDDQITLFDSTGVAIEDVAAAVALYREAGRRGGCTSLALGAMHEG